MKIYKHLYFEPRIARKKKKMIRKLKCGKPPMFVYVIILGKESDQLEVFQGTYLQQEYYAVNEPYLIGIASSYEGAICLVETIVKEVYEQTGDARIKEYLLAKKE